MKKPTTKKGAAAKEPKTPKEPKAAKAAKRSTSNLVDPELRAIFLSDLDKFIKADDRVKKAQKALNEVKALIKGDGFSMRQIKVAIQLSTPEGEAEYKMQVANDLLAAQYAGAAIGSQLSMFLEPDRTPAVDIAKDEGTKDSMEGKSAKPKYDPSTPQHKAYMEAFHAETARRVKGGIKPLDDDKPAANEMH